MKLSLCKSFASFNFSSEVWCGKLWFFILVVPSLYMIQVPLDFGKKKGKLELHNKSKLDGPYNS
jgi:hypothetical protein